MSIIVSIENVAHPYGFEGETMYKFHNQIDQYFAQGYKIKSQSSCAANTDKGCVYVVTFVLEKD